MPLHAVDRRGSPRCAVTDRYLPLPTVIAGHLLAALPAAVTCHYIPLHAVAGDLLAALPAAVTYRYLP